MSDIERNHNENLVVNEELVVIFELFIFHV